MDLKIIALKASLIVNGVETPSQIISCYYWSELPIKQALADIFWQAFSDFTVLKSLNYNTDLAGSWQHTEYKLSEKDLGITESSEEKVSIGTIFDGKIVMANLITSPSAIAKDIFIKISKLTSEEISQVGAEIESLTEGSDSYEVFDAFEQFKPCLPIESQELESQGYAKAKSNETYFTLFANAVIIEPAYPSQAF